MSDASYFILDCLGNKQISELSKVDCYPSQSIAICIDNNICQELAKWENNNNVDPKTRIKVETFLKECADYNLFVFPYIGLTELSTNRLTGKLDQVKYVSHQKSISSCLYSGPQNPDNSLRW